MNCIQNYDLNSSHFAGKGGLWWGKSWLLWTSYLNDKVSLHQYMYYLDTECQSSYVHVK